MEHWEFRQRHMNKMLLAVRKKTGYNLTAEELVSLLNDYGDMSNKKLEASLKRMVKGERGGEDVETTAAIEEIETVLAARRAWE